MKVVVNEQLGIQEIEIIINCSSKDETVQKIVSSLSVIDMKLTSWFQHRERFPWTEHL